jgi:hypothetical protein
LMGEKGNYPNFILWNKSSSKFYKWVCGVKEKENFITSYFILQVF